MTDWRDNGVRVVRGDELDPNTPQTEGMRRAAAITTARAGAEKLWAGTVVIEPDAKTGAHHHGAAGERHLRRQRPRAHALGRAAGVPRRGGAGRLHLRAALRAPPGDQREPRVAALVRASCAAVRSRWSSTSTSPTSRRAPRTCAGWTTSTAGSPNACPSQSTSVTPDSPGGARRSPIASAPHAASRTPATEDQVRGLVGAAFFLLSVYYVASTVARMIKAARD